MANLTKKNFIFFSKDGYTYDKSNKLTNNMQLFGTGKGENIIEALVTQEEFNKLQSNKAKFHYVLPQNLLRNSILVPSAIIFRSMLFFLGDTYPMIIVFIGI